MGNEWKTFTLEEVCTIITDGAHFSPKEDPHGFPMASVKDLTRYGIDLTSCKRISLDDFNMLKRQGCAPQFGDVLIAKDGNSALDTVCVHQLSQEVVLLSSVAILRPNLERTIPSFLRYYLDSPDTRRMLKSSYRSGSAIPRVVLKDFRRAPIALPPLPEQRAIAAVLGALDDKIELNRRMNRTLEEMARALFRSWFVDFDPVRAKMAGRATGLPEAIEALFPGEMGETTEVDMPTGWKRGTFSDIIVPTIGGDWGQDVPFEESVEVICLRGVDLERLRASGWSDAPSRWIKRSSLEKRQVTERDVLVAASGVGPLGRSLWLISSIQQMYDKPVIYSNFCKRFQGYTPAHAVYAAHVLHEMRESGEIWKYSSGTSIPNLNQEAILTMHPILVPPDALLEQFYAFARPIYAKLFNSESLILAALRDGLLPKLMSGEVRVKEAAKLV